MAKKFQATFGVRFGNRILMTLLRAGFGISNMTLLTVRGRKSGQLRTNPVSIVEIDGKRWLSTPYGDVNWVRNLRAAGEATLTRRRRSERVSATEQSAHDAAPILKHILGIAPAFLLPYYDVTPTSSLEDFERDAVHHPVFLLETIADTAQASGNIQWGL